MQTPASSRQQCQPVHSFVLSSCRRSLVEAIYNRLNLYREEDGVSVAKCSLLFGPFILCVLTSLVKIFRTHLTFSQNFSLDQTFALCVCVCVIFSLFLLQCV